MGEFAYFMIRVRRDPGEGLLAAISGVLEHLGTGEKQSFASGEELLRLVSGQPTMAPDTMMQLDLEIRNSSSSE